MAPLQATEPRSNSTTLSHSTIEEDFTVKPTVCLEDRVVRANIANDWMNVRARTVHGQNRLLTRVGNLSRRTATLVCYFEGMKKKNRRRSRREEVSGTLKGMWKTSTGNTMQLVNCTICSATRGPTTRLNKHEVVRHKMNDCIATASKLAAMTAPAI